MSGMGVAVTPFSVADGIAALQATDNALVKIQAMLIIRVRMFMSHQTAGRAIGFPLALRC